MSHLILTFSTLWRTDPFSVITLSVTNAFTFPVSPLGNKRKHPWTHCIDVRDWFWIGPWLALDPVDYVLIRRPSQVAAAAELGMTPPFFQLHQRAGSGGGRFKRRGRGSRVDFFRHALGPLDQPAFDTLHRFRPQQVSSQGLWWHCFHQHVDKWSLRASTARSSLTFRCVSTAARGVGVVWVRAFI